MLVIVFRTLTRLAGILMAAVLSVGSGGPAVMVASVAADDVTRDSVFSSNGETTNGTFPDNPSMTLPRTIMDSIPDDATMISESLARLSDGTVRNVETGGIVTDSSVIGTSTQPPDPLDRTDGQRFIPVSVGKVREAMSSSESGSGSVRTAALSDNTYGAYWGTYNGSSAFFNADGTLFVQQAKGVIDVSEWQGTIDWRKVKAAGVQGAIILIGYAWDNGFDEEAVRNITWCKRLGIPFGVYLYSYAYDVDTAAAEGANVAALLKKAGVSPGDLSYPIYYDLEDWTWSDSDGKPIHVPPTNTANYEAIIGAWYKELNSAGYTDLGVYSYTSRLNGVLKSSYIWSKTTWVAQYGAKNEFTGFTSNSRGWQYTDEGSVSGISGNVDFSAFGNYRKTADFSAGSVYRVYNPNSGLHHYTMNGNEVTNLVVAGWTYEMVAFRSASSSGVPVYRVYNPNNGNHHFTESWGERTILVSKGWRYEGVAWYANKHSSVPVYRLYNPHNGEHLYTTNYAEYQKVKAAGWSAEGIAWYA